jgi:transcriptional regulator with XRE-family HTH domain
MEIGTKIRLLREKNKMSQTELAQHLGIVQTTLGFIESGENKKIDFSIIDKICKIFNVDFEYFTNNSQTNNVKELNGSINNHGTINLISEHILEQIKYLVHDSKLKTQEIEKLNKIIRNSKNL